MKIFGAWCSAKGKGKGKRKGGINCVEDEAVAQNVEKPARDGACRGGGLTPRYQKKRKQLGGFEVEIGAWTEETQDFGSDYSARRPRMVAQE